MKLTNKYKIVNSNVFSLPFLDINKSAYMFNSKEDYKSFLTYLYSFNKFHWALNRHINGNRDIEYYDEYKYFALSIGYGGDCLLGYGDLEFYLSKDVPVYMVEYENNVFYFKEMRRDKMIKVKDYTDKKSLLNIAANIKNDKYVTGEEIVFYSTEKDDNIVDIIYYVFNLKTNNRSTIEADIQYHFYSGRAVNFYFGSSIYSLWHGNTNKWTLTKLT